MGTVEWIVLSSVGVLVGLGLGFFAGRLSGRGNSQKLADAEAELETYRQSVTEHFSQSAEHFQAIGRQYRELYEHMAAGSEKLCVGAPSDGQLKFPRPDEVSVEEPVADEEAANVEAVEEVAEAQASAPTEEATSADPEPIVAERPAEVEEKVDIAAPKAPADFASDDPKDRRYH